MLKLVASSFCSNTVQRSFAFAATLVILYHGLEWHTQPRPSLLTESPGHGFCCCSSLNLTLCFFKLQYLLLWMEYTKMPQTSGLETVTNFNCGWIFKEQILEGFVFHFTAWRYPTSLIKLHEENQNPKSWEDYSVWYGKIKSPKTTSSGYALE